MYVVSMQSTRLYIASASLQLGQSIEIDVCERFRSENIDCTSVSTEKGLGMFLFTYLFFSVIGDVFGIVSPVPDQATVPYPPPLPSGHRMPFGCQIDFSQRTAHRSRCLRGAVG